MILAGSQYAVIPTIKLPPETFAQPQANGPSDSKQSVDSLFKAALSQPIEFPPLSQLLFEGDKIAFVLLQHLPSQSQCLSGLFNHLLEFITPCQIDIVTSMEIELDEQQQASWSEKFKQRDVELNFVLHDASDSQRHAFLAASYTGEPIYIDRTLFDADTVIPVTSKSNTDPDGRPLVYPEFSNSQTRIRFQAAASDELRGEFRMAYEALGICYVIEVVSGPGGEILSVSSGEHEKVANHTQQTVSSNWHVQRSEDARVVVATVETPESGQTWDHFFKALIAAAAASENAQQIVVCTNIDSLPSDIHYQLLQLPFETDCELLTQVMSSAPEIYRAIPGIFEEATIYLKSRLSESEVEDLGLGFISSDSDIQRIVDNAESGIYLRDAHLCKVADDV